MSNNFRGDIIEESLKDKGVIEKLNIISTRVEKVTEEHHTPWLSQWTLHTVEIPEDKVAEIAEELSKCLDDDQGRNGSWYADFKNDFYHYIIFKNKVFCVDRKSKEQYDEAERYGISIGIPAAQLINYEGEYKDRINEKVD